MRRAVALVAMAIAVAGCSSDGSASVTDRSGDEIPAVEPALRERLATELDERTDEGRALLDDESVVVTTTLDPLVHDAIDRAVATVPSTDGRFVPGVVVTDPRSGSVLGLRSPIASGGRDVMATQRGSGSTLKIPVLLAAARLGITPDTPVDGAVDCQFMTDDGPYDAADASTLAKGTLADMTAASINCAFARIATAAGPELLAGALADLGMAPKPDLGARFAVGGNTVSGDELVRALAAVLTDGRVRPLHVVERVERDGQPLELAALPSGEMTTTTEERSAMLTSLVQVLERGTASSARLAGGRPAAGKTGTQTANTDAWFVGGTPSLVAVVWLGNPADPTDSMSALPEFGLDPVRGARVAEVWRLVVDDVLAGTPIEPIPGI